MLARRAAALAMRAARLSSEFTKLFYHEERGEDDRVRHHGSTKRLLRHARRARFGVSVWHREESRVRRRKQASGLLRCPSLPRSERLPDRARAREVARHHGGRSSRRREPRRARPTLRRGSGRRRHSRRLTARGQQGGGPMTFDDRPHRSHADSNSVSDWRSVELWSY